MKITAPSFLVHRPSSVASVLLCVVSAVGSLHVAHAATLYGPTYYQNPVASSEFSGGGFPITSVFLNSPGDWAIAGGPTPTNPQGRNQAWFNFSLDQEYSISAILFAPRNATGSVDGIDILNVWISTTPFSVDVTNATSTNSFLTANPTPTWSKSGFANNSTQTYSLPSPVNGQYFVAEIINTTDTTLASNIGAKQFVVDAVAVPEPSSLMLLGCGMLGGLMVVCRRR